MSDKLNKDFWKLFEDEGTVIEIDRPDFESIVNKNYIKDLRKNLDLTQKVLGDVLGVTKKTIEKWEQGKNPVKGPSAILLYLLDKDVKILEHFYSFGRVNQETNEIEDVLYKNSEERIMYLAEEDDCETYGKTNKKEK